MDDFKSVVAEIIAAKPIHLTKAWIKERSNPILCVIPQDHYKFMVKKAVRVKKYKQPSLF